MKSRLITFIIAAITLFSMVASFILLRKIQNEREKYETFLLGISRKIDMPKSGEESKSLDEPQMASFQDFLQTVNPKEKRVPTERLHQAYRDIMASQVNESLKDGNPLQWEFVPSNMGGRTRASCMTQTA